MIHEVVGVEAKLQLLPFPDIEVLEQSQVRIEVSRSIDDRQSSRPVLADLIGECEATRVDELVRREIRSGVAGNNRRKRNVRRPKQRGSADVLSGAWNLGAVESQVEALAPLAGEIDATLDLRDSGNLPAIEEAAGQLVPGNFSKVVRVSRVEDMGAVRLLHTVVVVDVERVQRGADNTERFAERVVAVMTALPLVRIYFVCREL